MMGRKLNETLDFSQNNYLLGTAFQCFGSSKEWRNQRNEGKVEAIINFPSIYN